MSGDTATAELYSPAANTWSAAASLPTVVAGHTATLLRNSQVLVAGGIIGVGGGYVVTANCELYNPAANTWSSAASMTNARDGHTATLLPSGAALVVGGQPGTVTPTAELYYP